MVSDSCSASAGYALPIHLNSTIYFLNFGLCEIYDILLKIQYRIIINTHVTHSNLNLPPNRKKNPNEWNKYSILPAKSCIFEILTYFFIVWFLSGQFKKFSVSPLYATSGENLTIPTWQIRSTFMHAYSFKFGDHFYLVDSNLV